MELMATMSTAWATSNSISTMKAICIFMKNPSGKSIQFHVEEILFDGPETRCRRDHDLVMHVVALEVHACGVYVGAESEVILGRSGAVLDEAGVEAAGGRHVRGAAYAAGDVELDCAILRRECVRRVVDRGSEPEHAVSIYRLGIRGRSSSRIDEIVCAVGGKAYLPSDFRGPRPCEHLI